ncbi:LysR family transcriptional regulator [Oceanimonas baumannii]|uniref:DNA-binding transcriptional LysR family regulator n=1 Tax=Oceanimonas baumannii TaxID=129578 RepID=A0A235CFF4_9GAMM|nr:LysR family transcriptional regulator [Oceanimonas baumannii]OYD23351.1 LysR family transcriptional regulator [Oceanimonas baumannii]TDW58499.1 DNA-binding transcriptional LysR family regulator [Oceanimonas baumannii]
MNAQPDDWHEIHTAYQVARLGSLSAAAQQLEVHHSTVLRRINALETRMGARLFHRHPRGYVATEAGRALLAAAAQAEQAFSVMRARVNESETLAGTLILTSVNNLVPYLTPLLAEFQQLHPNIRLEYAADSRVFRLEQGEAHVGIRSVFKPDHPDYVVQRLTRATGTLYANREYLRRHGHMSSLEDLAGHRFIGTTRPCSSSMYMRWMEANVPAEQVRYRVQDFTGFIPALQAGLGCGPLSCWHASLAPELQPLLPPPGEWAHDLWLTSHGDMHRSAKVQAFTGFLKARIAERQADFMPA